MKYLQHFCLIWVLLTQAAFAQLLPVNNATLTHTEQAVTAQTYQPKAVIEHNTDHDCAMPLQDCVSDCKTQKPCINYCNASVFIPSLTNELLEPRCHSEAITGKFWASQTTVHTPILFPPIA